MEVRELVGMCRTEKSPGGAKYVETANAGAPTASTTSWGGPLPPSSGATMFEACGTGNAYSCGTRSAGGSCGTCLRNGHETVLPQYVGTGKGAYLEVSKYRYVGVGSGEFDIIEEPSKCQLSLRSALLLLGVGVGVIVTLVAVGIWHFCAPRAGAGAAAARTSKTAADRDAAGALLAASAASVLRPSSKAAFTFDCVMGYTDWEHRWTSEKKEYCCKTFRRGCNATAAASRKFDCKVGTEHWETGWSDEKRTWCCRRGEAPDGARCSNATVADSNPKGFDCDAGFLNSAKGWSKQKKAFCCRRAHRACPARHRQAGEQPHGRPDDGSDSPPYDCSAGLSVWRIGWSPGKKTWCCDHRHLGCLEESNSSSVSAALDATRARAAAANAAERNGTRGNSEAYDCRGSPSNPESDWTPGHKAWCCLFKGVACPPTLETV